MVTPKIVASRVAIGLAAELPSPTNTDITPGDAFGMTDRGSLAVCVPKAGGGVMWANAPPFVTIYEGGARLQRRPTAGNLTCDSASLTDYIVGVTSTAAARTITLPPATAGRVIVVKDESGGAGTNNITVVPAAGTIDGAANSVISTNYGSRGFYSDGTNWFTT